MSSVLIEGPPGSGKTTLALQILYSGIVQYRVPAILFSFEQRPEQIIRDAGRFGWDLQKAIDEDLLRIVATSPMKVQNTLGSLASEIDAEIETAYQDVMPRRALIDSISHFRRASVDENVVRESVHSFIESLSSRGITTFLTKEIAGDEAGIDFEEYAVDASLRLHNTSLGGLRGNLRTVEIRKTRGHGHLSGRHPLFFEKSGIVVYPRREPRVRPVATAVDLSRPRVSTGTPTLDRLIGGGLPAHSCTLVAGSTGVGKTALCLAFLAEGLRRGENGLIITLSESPNRVAEMMALTGIDIAAALESGALTIEHRSPVNLCVERVYWDLEHGIPERNIRRVVLDGASDFETSVRDPDALRDYAYGLLKLLEELNVTSLITRQTDCLAGGLNLANIPLAYIMDGIILMGFAEIESRMRRVISILKMSGTILDTELRELSLTSEGLVVGGKFAGLAGVLGGMPTGQYQETVEEILQPLYFLKSFSQMLAASQLDDARRQQIASELKEQAEKVVAFICDYHGIDPERIGKQIK